MANAQGQPYFPDIKNSNELVLQLNLINQSDICAKKNLNNQCWGKNHSIIRTIFMKNLLIYTM